MPVALPLPAWPARHAHGHPLLVPLLDRWRGWIQTQAGARPLQPELSLSVGREHGEPSQEIV